MRLDNTYQIPIDNLIAGAYPPAFPDAIVTLQANQGILKRGTLIGTDENDENGKPIGSDFNFSSDAKSAFVLFADVDTDEAEDESINAQAYQSGNFSVTELILGEGYTLTPTDLREMRKLNMVVSGDYPTYIEQEDE